MFQLNLNMMSNSTDIAISWTYLSNATTIEIYHPSHLITLYTIISCFGIIGNIYVLLIIMSSVVMKRKKNNLLIVNQVNKMYFSYHPMNKCITVNTIYHIFLLWSHNVVYTEVNTHTCSNKKSFFTNLDS